MYRLNREAAKAVILEHEDFDFEEGGEDVNEFDLWSVGGDNHARAVEQFIYMLQGEGAFEPEVNAIERDPGDLPILVYALDSGESDPPAVLVALDLPGFNPAMRLTGITVEARDLFGDEKGIDAMLDGVEEVLREANAILPFGILVAAAVKAKEQAELIEAIDQASRQEERIDAAVTAICRWRSIEASGVVGLPLRDRVEWLLQQVGTSGFEQVLSGEGAWFQREDA